MANIINTVFQIAKPFRFLRPRLLVQLAVSIVRITNFDPPFPPKLLVLIQPTKLHDVSSQIIKMFTTSQGEPETSHIVLLLRISLGRN